MDSLFVDDGYTATRHIPAVPGLHPELVVMFRPALERERNAWRLKGQSTDPLVLEKHATDLIKKYLVSLNGDQLDEPKIARLKPAVRSHVVDLILGYLPADEASDAKN